MTKEQKKLKQLQSLNVALKETNDELAGELQVQQGALDYGCELLGRTTAQLNRSTETVNALRKQCDSIGQTNANLERTRQITAEGLMIERDELLVRARRLAMRIRGLGFDV